MSSPIRPRFANVPEMAKVVGGALDGFPLVLVLAASAMEHPVLSTAVWGESFVSACLRILSLITALAIVEQESTKQAVDAMVDSIPLTAVDSEIVRDAEGKSKVANPSGSAARHRNARCQVAPQSERRCWISLGCASSGCARCSHSLNIQMLSWPPLWADLMTTMTSTNGTQDWP